MSHAEETGTLLDRLLSISVQSVPDSCRVRQDEEARRASISGRDALLATAMCRSPLSPV